ncbi:TIR domain-containing protein [Actinoplanes sp. NBRC 101535]|uniref:toll/interleukin-1 receptor domain-containing protein n=1 Tax=Actinoplanes sp. NBRC 101535 TaxID=3032196 RepID=UPI0024A47C63|nr:TIR domain-containing protein [Actinoplanes sp. NBRC 101535]GLY02257.1 hypothetical protein Acsp01_26360 [Actinoplanes sp. NBRC 101535]
MGEPTLRPAPRYDAFISYARSRDGALAAALHAELERFAGSWWRSRRLRVFHDLASLPASAGLRESLERSLARSEWFVLLASPESARSRWVGHEVDWWLANRSTDRILIAVTGGTLRWDGGTDALSPSLAAAFAEEPHWIDLRPYAGTTGRPLLGDIVADLAAPILGVDKDTLVGEHLRRRRGATRTLIAAVVVLILLAVTAVGGAVIARNQAREAERQAAVATARQLQALADVSLPTDPRTALGLSLAAHRIDPGDESDRGVYRTLASTPYVSTLSAHRKPVTATAFASAQRLLALGDDDGAVSVWDLADPARPRLRHGPADLGIGVVSALAFESGGTVLAVGGVTDPAQSRAVSRVALWDVAQPFAVGHRVLPALTGRLTALTFLPGRPMLAGTLVEPYPAKPSLHLWGTPSVAQARPSGAPAVSADGDPMALAATGDGRHLVMGSSQGDGTTIAGSVTLWAVDDAGTPRRIAAAQLGPVASVAVSGDGHTVAAGGQDRTGAGSITLFDITDRKRVRRMDTAFGSRPDPVAGVALSPDGRLLAEAGGRSLRLWDVHDRNDPIAVDTPGEAHQDDVRTVVFAGDGGILVTGSADTTGIVWDAHGRTAPDAAGTVTLRPRGTPADPWWASAEGKMLRGVLGAPGTVTSYRVRALPSPDGRLIVTTDLDGQAVLWQTGPDGRSRQLPVPADRLSAVTWAAFDPGFHLLITAGAERAQLWDVTDPSRPAPLGPAMTGVVPPAAFSADGRLLVIDGVDEDDGNGVLTSTVTVYDLTDPGRPRQLSRIDGTRETLVKSLALSPDSATLAVADSSDTRLYDLSDLSAPVRLAKSLPKTADPVAFTPDGRTLAGVSRQTLVLWNVEDPRDPRPLGTPLPLAYEGEASTITVTRDSRRVSVTTPVPGPADDLGVQSWDMSRLVRLRAEAPESACTMTDAASSGAVEWRRYLDTPETVRLCPGP